MGERASHEGRLSRGSGETAIRTVADIAAYLEEIGQLRRLVAASPADVARQLSGLNTDADAGPGELAWTKRPGRAGVFRGALLLCDEEGAAGYEARPGQAVAVCRRPRLAMARVVRRFFAHLTFDRPPDFEDDRLAAACAANGAWVMNARIAGGVTVAPHATIGCSGMGYERDDDGTLVGFPQLGGVVIERDVDVAAHATIQRGAIGDTRIRRGAKVGPHVNVGHNVEIGADVLIAGHCQIGGGARIGARAVLWQSAAVANGVEVGEGAVIGMGAMIRKDVPPGEVWVGNPARRLEK